MIRIVIPKGRFHRSRIDVLERLTHLTTRHRTVRLGRQVITGMYLEGYLDGQASLESAADRLDDNARLWMQDDEDMQTWMIVA